MSKLFNNTTSLNEILEAIQNKAAGGDLTSEVEEYTSKITELETAITALENELQGKASGGGGMKTCTLKIIGDKTARFDLYSINTANGIVTYNSSVVTGPFELEFNNVYTNQLFMFNGDSNSMDGTSFICDEKFIKRLFAGDALYLMYYITEDVEQDQVITLTVQDGDL
jgi:hypothetical protein